MFSSKKFDGSARGVYIGNVESSGFNANPLKKSSFVNTGGDENSSAENSMEVPISEMRILWDAIDERVKNAADDPFHLSSTGGNDFKIRLNERGMTSLMAHLRKHGLKIVPHDE